jgi:arginyl-tRNA--protein-N-Asp/Glu arginylyltransferase
MNKLLKECTLNEDCAYLDGHHQTTHYKIIDQCNVQYYHSLVIRGWRRFGNMFFRPVCRECTACESVKIDVANYRFSKSARRVIRKNQNFRMLIQRPTMTQSHLNLFDKYHNHMKEKRNWDTQVINPRNYYMSFVNGYGKFGYEVLYFDRDKLIGVDLIDLLPDGVSSIYFYYDPDYAVYSLGHYSLYRQILYAQQQKLRWIYLGYYVEGCQSLAYKKDYSPLFVLENRPEETMEAVWKLFTEP